MSDYELIEDILSSKKIFTINEAKKFDISNTYIRKIFNNQKDELFDSIKMQISIAQQSNIYHTKILLDDDTMPEELTKLERKYLRHMYMIYIRNKLSKSFSIKIEKYKKSNSESGYEARLNWEYRPSKICCCILF